MSLDEETAGAFLYELYQQTEGDLEGQLSMHTVGEALGLDKDAAGALAQDLMMAELVELRTLAGGISLTEKGLAALRDKGMVAAGGPGEVEKLSGEEVLNEYDRGILDMVIAEIRTTVAEVEMGFEDLEAMVIDIKTIEVQLLSKAAKVAVIAAVLRSLQSSFSRLRQEKLAQKIENLLAEV